MSPLESAQKQVGYEVSRDALCWYVERMVLFLREECETAAEHRDAVQRIEMAVRAIPVPNVESME